MLGALSVTLVACSSQQTTAYCTDSQTDANGAYRVVDDDYCDNDGDGTRVGYFWYYGGRYHNGYIAGGSSVKPKGHKIKSVGGKTLSRGGFGGGKSSGG